MDILRLDPDHERWPDLLRQLRHENMARWVVDDDGQPSGAFLFLGALVDGAIVGNLTLREQPIVVPGTTWAGDRERVLRGLDGETLRETYVQTFAVDETYQRRGIGRALQAEALVWTRDRGCVQMRSWSSLDRPENYALKLGMGFALDPAVHEAAEGLRVSGVYFVKRVDGADSG
ncbi:MAG: GNAT family N-acetyltransferase [Planctomycetota bacterium]|nr:GNAT family N-acetyltransferase [Planctomycetota bacterium]